MSSRVPDQPTCREIVELITDYLEGRLPLEARTRLEQHLVFCDWCRVYLEQIHQTIRVAGAVTEESLSPEKREELVRLFRDWKGKK
ncbi:MAG TPA: zf-HC2 domain-containing protein [Myxococcales bacterium]|nr:zf-HC2 domain-containing protein [Myxococcales bacterium]